VSQGHKEDAAQQVLGYMQLLVTIPAGTSHRAHLHINMTTRRSVVASK
jgi:hypothetical protein